MDIDQLKGRRHRLKTELAIERAAQPCRSGLVGRLMRDIARVECEITLLESTQRPAIGWYTDEPELQRAA